MGSSLGKGGGGGGGHLSSEDIQYLQDYPHLQNTSWVVGNPRKHFEDFGRAEGKIYGGEGGPSSGGFDIEGFLSGLGGGGGGGSDYAAQLAAQREKDRITFGENERDALYSDYLTAAESATDFINLSETERIANEDLLGIDHPIRTDEQKAIMINDYFATVWGEGQQQRLDTLFGEFGNPSGFEGFTVTRGDGSVYDTREGDETVVASTGSSVGGVGNRNRKLVDDTILTETGQESVLGTPSILGA